MSKVLVTADAIFHRTVQLLNDTSVDLMRVVPPVPRIVRLNRLGLGAGSCLMWEVDRPDFVIDESDLPY